MIDLQPDDMIEWDGFDVYDAETGENLFPEDVAKRERSKRVFQLVDGFCLDWEGALRLTLADGNTEYIPKQGRYLVQINGGKYMRW